MTMKTHLLAGALALTTASAFTQPARAQARQHYDLPEQDLGTALKTFAAISGREVVASSDVVARKRSAAIRGDFAPAQAIALLLLRTGLRVEVVGGAFVIRPTGDINAAGGDPPEGDIVITGTNIRGAQPAGSRVVTVTRADIDRSGLGTTQQILQTLPQNFGGGPNEGTVGFSIRNNTNSNFGFGSSLNLRGLGTNSTLTLIDGVRPALGGASGTFVDLSLIPSSAIERVEVLADGASALYGSDAVAGVVNIKLRNDFVGVESRARYGFADGFDEKQASQLVGLKWASGRIVLGYEFYDRSRLGADDRPYGTEDLRSFGGPDYRKTFANPGTIIAADGSIFGIPAGQNGAGLTAARLVAGVANKSDGRDGTDLLPASRRHAAFVSLTQDLTQGLQFFARGFFGDRITVTRTYPDNYGGVVVPTSNPFYVDPIGTHEPIGVNYNFVRDFGPETERSHVRMWGGVAGLAATLGPWSLDFHGSYGAQFEAERTTNIPNYFRLATALADPNPATAYNVLGDGSFTNRSTIDRVEGSYYLSGKSTIWSMGAKAEGPLFRLSAGEVRLAVGGEYRHERYGSTSIDDEFTPSPVDGGSAGFPIRRSVWAGYGELFLPLVSPAQGVTAIDKLDVSIAARVERYSDFGTTANPKVGVSWRPIASLTLRGTFGASFRAPSFIDIRTGKGTTLYAPLPLPDPASPTGYTNALALFGGRPGIGPERARTWTIGGSFKPAALPGLAISMTYFHIGYRDRIGSVGNDYQSFLTNRARYQSVITDHPSAAIVADYYADQNFINPYDIPASQIAVIVDGRTTNIARLDENGVDFDLGYRATTGANSFELGVSSTYLFTIDQRLIANQPASNVVSTIGNPVDLRLRARASATFGRVALSGFVNFVDGYLNDVVTPIARVDSWTTVDLQLAYTLPSRGPLRGLQFSLSVTNLFDRDPPYVNNATTFSAAGFDPENASPIGRMVALQLIKKW